ncbi:S-adenosyl-L-methionine-dependent methyltransferase [Wallemia mellicola]|nr:S-adenosyl-L-methionine-dependent methyltransferase [Wallemia mellicola]
MLVNKLPKSRIFIRFYSTSHLPARNSWKKEFSFVGTKLRGRDTISCLDTARQFVKDVGIQEMGSSTTPVTVIDAYSGRIGFGLVSKALLELENVGKVISIEPAHTFNKVLSALSEEHNNRMVYIDKDPYDWQVYTDIEQAGLLKDVQTRSWENIHDHFAVFMQVPATVHGEQLIGQFFHCMVFRSWLFNRGRIPMGLLINSPSYDRLVHSPGHPDRGRIATIREATAIIDVVIPEKDLLPENDKIYPQVRQPNKKTKKGANILNYVGTKITPHVDIIPDTTTLDAWEFVTRQIFITRRYSLRKSLKHLAVNADVALSKPLEDRGVDLDKLVRDLTIEEIAKIIDAFLEWPFRPER